MGLLEPHGRHRGRHGQAVIRLIVFHGLGDALAIAEAARSRNLRIDLVTPAGASAYLGAGLFREIVREVRAKTSEIDCIFYDCGNRRGGVMGGLRAGIKEFCVDTSTLCPALIDLAKKYDVQIIERPVNCLQWHETLFNS